MKPFRIIIILFLLICVQRIRAQSVLDQYLQEGLANNQQLLQEVLAVENSYLSKSQANGLFLPTVNFEADYTLANGGRDIRIPVGDLLNPVYNTLNQLTDSEQFPNIENVDEQLLPNDFHETKLRIIQPLFNTDIYYNRAINSTLVNVAEARKKAYEVELVKEIKLAYFNYLQAYHAIRIYQANEQALKALVSFNESRFEEDLITKDEVYRSQYQLEELRADKATAVAQMETARAYFNFLLNRPYDAGIELDSTLQFPIQSQSTGTVGDAWQRRAEVDQIKAAQEAQGLEFKMLNSRRFLPQINAVADFGYQGFGYEFDNEQEFWLVNFSLSWNIFSGFQKQHQAQMAKIKLQSLNSQEEQLRSRIAMEVIKSQNEFLASRNRYTARNKGLDAAQRNFEITKRRYEEDQALLIEFLDAQSSFISAQLDQSISKYQVLSREAELERALAY